ncbi:AAA family ATPase [Microbacterium sp. DT81.1]|uniref:AAA family ATPase n=1 Tax=Microbacterium sp. DT81.1 TaxID=3393413 RepID=UPI003CE84E3E
MPTYFEPSIRTLRVEAFRGFRDYQEFDLDASAVIVTGPNGTGKTSFFDAMQWCLVGSIERLEGLRSRRSIEHIVNQFRVPDRAMVELELVAAGRRFTVRRSGDQSGSTLEFREAGAPSRFGDEATRALHNALVGGSELTLDGLLSTSGLMQQDVMRSVLEAKPAERYRHLSAVLGLGRLEDFEDAVREAAHDAKSRADAARLTLERSEADLNHSRSRLDTQERLALATPQFDSMRQGLLDAIAVPSSGVTLDFSSLHFRDVDSFAAAADLISSAIEAVEQLDRTRERARLLTDGEPMDSTELDINAATAARDDAGRSVGRKREALTEASRELDIARNAGESMARLAAVAIPLLSDKCPVCGQHIDRAHVERELLSISAETQTVLALTETLATAREELANAESQLASAEQIVQQQTAALRRRVERDRAIERVAHDEVAVRALKPAITFDEDREGLLPGGTGPAVDRLQVIRGRIRDLISTVDSAVSQSGVERARSEIHSLEDAVASRRERATLEANRSRELKKLADAAVDARVAVTNQRFEAVQPLVADIYRRLDPHPVFKELEFELDTYYRRGTTTPIVRDEVTGVTADPLLVFSTSQANIAALSYFLAMGWSAGSDALPFILLDDPVQSMDDVNVLGFADLCRHLRQDRQLIISTHERRFANLLERKLAPRAENETTKVIQFVAWDRGGPVVERRELSSSPELSTLRVVKRAS